MTTLRIIKPIQSNVPPQLAPVLKDMREAITQLQAGMGFSGDTFGDAVIQIITDSGIIKDPAPQQDLEPLFEGLRELTRQAQQQAQSLSDRITVNADMAFDSLGQSQRNLTDIIGIADDLAEQAEDLAEQAEDLLDLATDVDLLQTTVGGLEDDFLATSTLLDATVSRVDATEDSIDVISAAITSLQAELVDTTAFDPGIVWQFEGSVDGWTSNFTLGTNDYFISVPDDAGAYIRSPSAIAIDGRLYTRIIARIRRTAGTGWLGRASYATSGGSSHGIDTTNFHLTLATEPTFAGGGWVIVVWDMELLTAGGSDWVDNIIDQIQLELSDDAATEFDVDWVAIGRVAPSFFSGSLSALTSRVTATEDAITALSSDVTSLESRADDLEGDVSANTAAISTLSTRVTATEDSIDVNSADIVSLSSRIDDNDDDIAATSTALSALTTRVTTAEGTITTQSAQITSLDSRLDSAEADIDANASAITGLDTRIDATESSITAQAGQITALQTTVNHPTTGVAATATGLSTLTTRVTATENVNTSQATSLSALNAAITDPSTGLSANASAISALDTRVDSAEGQITSSVGAITLLTARSSNDSSLLNQLTTAGVATDWDTPGIGSLTNADVFSINIGGRTRVASRTRTITNGLQRASRFIELDPTGIYEVRMSVLKNLQNGRIYIGMFGSTTGTPASIDDVSSSPIVDRVIVGGPSTNNYFTLFGSSGATTNYQANTWYDFVFHILGPDAPVNRCPIASINGFPRPQMPAGLSLSSIFDGFKLQPGARFFSVRFLNADNSLQTDLYVNQVNLRRIFGRDAGLDQEIADRSAAIQTEQTARVAGDSANATSITNLTTTVNGQTTSISTLSSSVDGLNAQWAIRLDNNGRISGIKLAGSNTFASFSIIADQFSISLPGNPNVTTTPFTVGVVNGVPTVGINGNLVVDGTIVTSKLIAGGVTTEKIAANSVSKFVVATGITPAFPPSTSIVVCTASITGASVNSVFRIDWNCAVFHQQNVNPNGRISVQFTVFRNGSVITNKFASLNSANFTGEVFPPFTRTEFYGPGFNVGDVIAAEIRVTTGPTAGNNAFSVTSSAIQIEEKMR